MIGRTISHYKILEKLGEVPKWLTSASERVIAILRIPACLSGQTISHYKILDKLGEARPNDLLTMIGGLYHGW